MWVEHHSGKYFDCIIIIFQKFFYTKNLILKLKYQYYYMNTIVIVTIIIVIIILLAIGIFVLGIYINKPIDTTNNLTPIIPTPSSFYPVSPSSTPTPSYGPFIPISPAPTSSLYSNSYNTLQQNQRLVNGDYYMVPQSDGNLCIYDTRNAKAIWCSGSNKKVPHLTN
nr:bulb type mannose specific lectin [Mimivirus sp.]